MSELYHYGIKGQKHGVRKYQNEDGSLTPEGRIHYGVGDKKGKFTIKGTAKALKTYHNSPEANANRKEIGAGVAASVISTSLGLGSNYAKDVKKAMLNTDKKKTTKENTSNIKKQTGKSVSKGKSVASQHKGTKLKDFGRAIAIASAVTLTASLLSTTYGAYKLGFRPVKMAKDNVKYMNDKKKYYNTVIDYGSEENSLGQKIKDLKLKDIGNDFDDGFEYRKRLTAG